MICINENMAQLQHANITSYTRDGVTYLRTTITHATGKTVIETLVFPQSIEGLAEQLRALAQYLDTKKPTYL